jgi:hypothetical protein
VRDICASCFFFPDFSLLCGISLSTKGEFMCAYEIPLDFVETDWYLPTEAVAWAFYHLGFTEAQLPRDVIEVCFGLMYAEVHAIADLASELIYPYFAEKSPFLVDQFQEEVRLMFSNPKGFARILTPPFPASFWAGLTTWRPGRGGAGRRESNCLPTPPTNPLDKFVWSSRNGRGLITTCKPIRPAGLLRRADGPLWNHISVITFPILLAMDAGLRFRPVLVLPHVQWRSLCPIQRKFSSLAPASFDSTALRPTP